MTPTQTRRATTAARRKIRRQIAERGFDAREEAWLDAITDGVPVLEAAKATGIAQKLARVRMMMPDFQGEVSRRMVSIRTAAGPRNIALALKLREDGFKPDASAADKKVALEACKYLDIADPRPSARLSIGVSIGPGLVIDLSDDPEPERPVLDLQASRPAPAMSALTNRVDLGDD
ncbi:hypothetical protein [Methylobacterium iners]|uniref:Uncharacterized protein n=1 Tax=Methylobacterium iners TaxID=418707 RepID=A0ABQ4RTU9_9HYPH|nr:hypothetical protein [Methylobacterium iners]GJD94149.1 hypothetical protein OCOJLMKI_1351 [Methylobacterium iners]